MRRLTNARSIVAALRKLGAVDHGKASAIAPVPVLHALGGAAGALDEIIAFGLILVFLLGLGFLARRSAGKSKARRRRRRAQAQNETKNKRG